MGDSKTSVFGTRLGFYLAAIGSAFGLGNLWRFPYVVAENGGGAFVLLYLFLVFLIGMPLLIWVVGNRVLGTYTHAQDPTAGTGPARLLADYFQGLTHGSLAFWCVAIGPYVLIWLARLLYGVARPSPARL